ncbi:chromate efflux transporter [Niabella yanshanensis]|uniref:Chromate efflux transporter n=1 Tax=Niabella yanshanensis TaxID=577386 RepID=A0ABZ0W8K5_9BACT|nr:chromate efflux transporter [Niabella yanshanensis]WQD39608.1 chromate efflux transporter [Niabella yanshanensis]
MSDSLKEIAKISFKLGCIGFGGIAGMISTIEKELVVKRKWIDHQHFMDVLSASYIIPGPNSVEIMMHCGKERGGRAGLITAGICYILPATLICLVFAFFYKQYSALPNVQRFISGIRPATTALVIGTLFRLSGTLKKSYWLIGLCILVFIGGLAGISEILLILGAGIVNCLFHSSRDRIRSVVLAPFLPLFVQDGSNFTLGKLFLIFLKIGAILYGSGYVLFAYMDADLVQRNHWLTRQQLMDAIAVGQLTPGPILSSATFAGYLVSGVSGGVLATTAIFLPSFFISLFLHRLLSYARRSKTLRLFLDGLSAASIAVIAIVGVNLTRTTLGDWRNSFILLLCLCLTLFVKKITTVAVIIIGAACGYLLTFY